MKKFTLFLAAALLSCVSFAATFEKVTAAPDDWSGEYILVYESSASEGYVWTGVDAAKCYSSQTIAANKISADGLVTITIAAMDGGYSVLVNGGTNNGKYAGVASLSNGLKFYDSAVKHRITLDKGTLNFCACVKDNNKDTVVFMRFNTGNSDMRFRYYKSGQKAIQLYKKSASLDQVASPTIIADGTAIAADTYIGTQNISLACATEGAVISYSLDNGETWTTYTTPITVSETTTLQAKATKDGLTDSEVKTVTITILESIANTQETALTTAQAITLIDNTLAAQLAAEKVYVKGTVSQVVEFNETYNSISYWLDEDAFYVYSGRGLNDADFTSISEVLVGADVVIYGNLKKYVKSSTTTYELDKNNYLVSYTAPAGAKEIATITLNGNKTEMESTEEYNEYTVTYNGDGELSITSSNEAVAKAIIEGTDVVVSVLGTGTTTITISAPETDKYLAAETKYTLTVVPAWVAASLPFTFDGGKSSIAPENGIKQSGLGDDYSSSPKLRFDNTGDVLFVRINETADTVAYTIKGNGVSGATMKFDVLQSANGIDYSPLASYTVDNLPKTATKETKTPASDARYFQFVYTEKANGNVALGAIRISKSKSTAIDNATAESPAVKMIENGQLIILRDGVKYNAMGVRLQ